MKSVTVAWPAPHLFTDDSGQSIGYKDGVIFPLRIEPQDPARPVILRLTARLCGLRKALRTGVGRCRTDTDPWSVQLRECARRGGSTGAEAKGARRGKGPDHSIDPARTGRGQAAGLVELIAPDNAEVALFAEGPAPDWALPIPELVAGPPDGRSPLHFLLEGLPPGASADGTTLTLTAVAGDNAIEVKARLD